MLDMYISNDPQDLQDGMLWQVIMPNGNVNYLRGTIHIYDILLQDSPELNYVFNASTSFLFEAGSLSVPNRAFNFLKVLLTLEVPESIELKFEGFWNDNKTRHEALCVAAYKIIKWLYFKDNDPNIPGFDSIKKLNPIILELILSFCGGEDNPENIMDYELFYDAMCKAKNDKNVVMVASVETLPDILMAYIAAAKDTSKEELNECYKEKLYLSNNFFSNMQSMIYCMLTPWPTQVDMALDSIKREPYNLNNLDRLWLIARNEKMWTQVAPHYEQGGCFFATGLAHCLGPDGFVESLLKQGCTVNRIYETKNIDNYYNEKLKLFCAGYLLAGAMVAPIYIPYVLQMAVASVFCVQTYNLLYCLEAMRIYNPKGLDSFWDDRTKALYSSVDGGLNNDGSDIAKELFTHKKYPIISRSILTQYMKEKENIQPTFIDIYSLDSQQKVGPSSPAP